MHDERLSSVRTKDYPLLLMSNHGRWRVHSQCDDITGPERRRPAKSPVSTAINTSRLGCIPRKQPRSGYQARRYSQGLQRTRDRPGRRVRYRAVDAGRDLHRPRGPYRPDHPRESRPWRRYQYYLSRRDYIQKMRSDRLPADTWCKSGRSRRKSWHNEKREPCGIRKKDTDSAAGLRFDAWVVKDNEGVKI